MAAPATGARRAACAFQRAPCRKRPYRYTPSRGGTRISSTFLRVTSARAATWEWRRGVERGVRGDLPPYA
eukprot:1064916-Prorocentrum_minimum.AAC.1